MASCCPKEEPIVMADPPPTVPDSTVSEADGKGDEDEEIVVRRRKPPQRRLYESSDEEFVPPHSSDSKTSVSSSSSSSNYSLRSRNTVVTTNKGVIIRLAPVRRPVVCDEDQESTDVEPIIIGPEDAFSTDSTVDQASSSSNATDAPRRKRGRPPKRPANDEDMDDEVRRELNKADGKRRRRILREDELSESTRKAMEEEAARQRRLLERQKSFGSDPNNSNLVTPIKLPVLPTDESFEDLPDLDGDSCLALYAAAANQNRVVFEEDPVTKQTILEVHPEIVAKLKPHQVEANLFMWQTVCESLDQLKNLENPGSGCIIAHCMGLGKTLSTIAFAHTLLTNSSKTGIRTFLILAPLNAQLNWIAEFMRWMPLHHDSLFSEGAESKSTKIHIYDLTSVKGGHAVRAEEIHKWQTTGGVMVMGYQMYRLLALASEPPEDQATAFGRHKKKKSSKILSQKTRDWLYEGLMKPGPDVVVFDEGHVLKSEKSALSQTMVQITTRRRIILTGTPLQNNLMEYHCMVSFVKPGLLGNAKEFQNRFVTPIRNGEHRDAAPEDVYIMKRRISVLYRALQSFVHRRGFEHLRSALPPKHEYVLLLRSTPEQTKCYLNYLRKVVRVPMNLDAEEEVGWLQKRLFGDYHALRYVCSHPYLLYVARKRAEEEEAREAQKRMLKLLPHDSESSDELFEENSMDGDGFLDGSDEENVEPADEEEDPPNRQERRLLPIITEPKKRTGRRMMLTISPDWFTSVIDEDSAMSHEVASKIIILMELVRQAELVNDKVLIFSQSLLFLDLIEDMLAREESLRCNSLAGDAYPHKNWQREIDFFRIDGSVPASARQEMINRFNQKGNDRGRLFLISTRAGGMGVNLVAANRAIILDISWNPANDTQAIFRTYRFGQTKPVYIYRLVSAGTMEEKIYDRQILKQALSHRVVDAKQIARHFTANEVRELYKFDAFENGMRPDNVSEPSVFNLPQDRIFAELLRLRPDVIKKYLDHDSLLAHQDQEELPEAERLAAWREYECEKKGFHVDCNDPERSHSSITSAYILRQNMAPTEASHQALLYLRDNFADVAPKIREYVDGHLKEKKGHKHQKALELKDMPNWQFATKKSQSKTANSRRPRAWNFYGRRRGYWNDSDDDDNNDWGEDFQYHQDHKPSSPPPTSASSLGNASSFRNFLSSFGGDRPSTSAGFPDPPAATNEVTIADAVNENLDDTASTASTVSAVIDDM